MCTFHINYELVSNRLEPTKLDKENEISKISQKNKCFSSNFLVV